jgi:hypothetical protein
MNDQAPESAVPTPPKQTPDDPNTADRRLTDEQKDGASEPAPPDRGRDLPKPPDPAEVGEAG